MNVFYSEGKNSYQRKNSKTSNPFRFLGLRKCYAFLVRYLVLGQSYQKSGTQLPPSRGWSRLGWKATTCRTLRMAYFWILVYLSNSLDTNQVWLCRWHVPYKVIILVSTTGKFLPFLLFFPSLTMVASSSFSILDTHHVNSRWSFLICSCKWWHSWRW